MAYLKSLLAVIAPAPSKNRFDRQEWAGAFGDIGTLIPFVVAYITLLDMNPLGVLFAFGLAKIASGLYYRTPFPVQPMKASGAIATTQAAQTITITQDMVYGAGLATGIIWFLLGVTGLTRRVAELVGRPVAQGIILGLGFSFMLEGIKMMAQAWLIGGIALAGTFLLLANKKLPAMMVLLIFGAMTAFIQTPGLASELKSIDFRLQLPEWALGTLTWRDFLLGAFFVALPQVPLTLSNAIIAITEENNSLFPDRRVTEKGVSISTGIMNLLAPMVGGVPMCHGAGGMAGHSAFGARTGGAMIILGSIIVLLALFSGDSIHVIFKMFPDPVLGVIVFVTGAQLALGTCAAKGFGKKENFAMLVTAAFGLWNIGIGFVAGMLLHHALQRGIVKL
ncbi:putative sulfate/molybdate transporter [Oxalobacteraceae bacterium R-40]|uniref:Sulfate/molybdate transporter n=1 Tax=Keguizhuia sedimenti TaxID=3064264 RepID=A0ABU1BNR8_9BURK|nr:putative sulfate/molybdate transporter [Oxalobacteraceae bacterium R-40]